MASTNFCWGFTKVNNISSNIPEYDCKILIFVQFGSWYNNIGLVYVITNYLDFNFTGNPNILNNLFFLQAHFIETWQTEW